MNSDWIVFDNYCQMDVAAFEELLSRMETGRGKQFIVIAGNVPLRQDLVDSY